VLPLLRAATTGFAAAHGASSYSRAAGLPSTTPHHEKTDGSPRQHWRNSDVTTWPRCTQLDFATFLLGTRLRGYGRRLQRRLARRPASSSLTSTYCCLCWRVAGVTTLRSDAKLCLPGTLPPPTPAIVLPLVLLKRMPLTIPTRTLKRVGFSRLRWQGDGGRGMVAGTASVRGSFARAELQPEKRAAGGDFSYRALI